MPQSRLSCYVYAIIILSYFYFLLDPAINKTGDRVHRTSLSWFPNRNLSARSSPAALPFNQTLTMKMLRFIQPILLLASCITASPFKVKSVRFYSNDWFDLYLEVKFPLVMLFKISNIITWGETHRVIAIHFPGGFTLGEEIRKTDTNRN